ncbi:MAG: hypothetical protein IJY66_06700, partial [Clostridia bacterium]|nr:hypothetical protein [Clostridia bacterium]
PRSAQDDARGRTQHIPTAFLPVEIPSVFAVLFEAAKAKFLLCNNRARLSKNAEAFLCVARDRGGTWGSSPMRVFFRRFLCRVTKKSAITQPTLEIFVRTS